MKRRDTYKRHSARVTGSKRWQAVRHAVLERDGWQCVECGSRRRLECDHIKPVRTHPKLAFDPANCQILCSSCHTRKTRIECGHPPPDPKRLQWRNAVAELAAKPTEQKETKCLIL
ncbi:HNH endonuclease [Pararhodobacter oceanensis]|uniref:HNH endonuclease n=1 Tax=Pararhodobacter oceanensis TaxID=2172121 RepID=UPI003A8F55EF